MAAQPLTVTAFGETLSCANFYAELWAQASGGIPPYIYTWSGPGGFVTNQQTPAVTQAGIYTVVVTDATGQTATALATVTSSYYPLSITTVVTPACDGACSGSITATASGPGGNNCPIFQWSNGATTNKITNLCPGTYTVTVTDCQTGCTSMATVGVAGFVALPPIVSSNPAPCNNPDLVGQGLVCEKVCPNQAVTYTVNSTSPNITLNWNITGAASFKVASNKKSATVTWGPSGGGSVAVWQSGLACPDSAAICVEVTEAPVALIGSAPAAVGSDLTVCANQPVYFKNESIHSDEIEWDFGDFSQKKTDQQPVHAWPVPGDYIVTLTARTACACSNTTYLTVHVQPGTPPTLDCLGTVCLGTEVTYTANEACGSYLWNVSAEGNVLGGGGPTDPSVTVQWASGELGQITLTALSCSPSVCPTPAVFEVPLISDFAEIKGDQRICSQEEAVYEIAPFGGANFVWKLGIGGSIVSGQGTRRVKVNWTAAPSFNTTHWLSVSYDNCYLGCGGIDSIPVKILPKYRATGPLAACESSTGSYSGQTITPSVALALNWELSDLSKKILWTASNVATTPIGFGFGPGTFRLKTTPADADKTCTDEYELFVTVQSPPAAPTAISGEAQICPGQPYTYSAGAAPGSNVFWTVTGGTPATQQGENAVVNWSAAGPYLLFAKNVSADALGCSSLPVTFSPLKMPAPTVAGDAAVCSQTEGSYSATVFQNIDYQWEILPTDAGTVSDGQGTTATKIFWAKPGSHQVRVTACGQSSVFDVLVRPLPEPVPVHPAVLCEGVKEAVSTTQVFSKYLWKKEDGATVSAAASPLLGAGHFEVEVTDGFGCVGGEIFHIDVRPTPDVEISSPDIEGDCPGLPPVRMYATDTDEGLDFQWFKNGSPVGTNDNLYIDTQVASYQVVATDKEGCTSASNILSILPCVICTNPSPAGCPAVLPLDFSILPTANCDTRKYVGVLSPPAQLNSQKWLFEGAPGSTLISPTTVYPSSGYKKVIFSAKFGNNQCGILKPDSVVLSANFKEKRACAGQVFEFEDISGILPPTSIDSWLWDFGDPASGADNASTTKNPTHTFAAPGTYDVRLTVTSSSGCTSSFLKKIQVAQPPTATILDPATNCAGNALPFVASSQTSDIATWEWSFGDPTSGDLDKATVNPAFHRFATAGNYVVSLKIKNISGCEATVSKPQAVEPNPLAGVISMVPGTGKICEGKTAKLTAPPGAVSWLWNTGEAANSLTTSKKGNYAVTITDSNGCTYSPPDAVVDVLPAPDAVVNALVKNDLGFTVGLTPSPLEICQGEDVFLQAQGNATGYTYSWSTGTSGPIEEFSEDRGNLLPVGTFNYVVTVTYSTTGCTNTTPPFTVTVDPVPTNVAIQSSAPAPICGHQNVVLSVKTPQTSLVYEWNTGQGGAFLSTNEAGNYNVVATNSYGCSATSNTLTVLPGAPIESVPSGCHARCAPDTVCFTPPPSAVSWQWHLNGAPIAGATMPNFIITQSGEYTVLITDASGCTAFSQPLSLSVLPGFGTVTGVVYSDKNQSGAVDAGDEPEVGIKIDLFENGALVSSALTNASGGYAFVNLPAKNYEVKVDKASLPADFGALIGEGSAAVVGCEDLDAVDFLLRKCIPTNPTLVNLTTCPGKPVFYQNQWLSGGDNIIINLKNNAGCDSVVSVSVTSLTPIASQTVQLSTCDSIQFNQKWLLPGVSESFIFQSANGCDSMVTAVVSGWPSAATSVSLAACDSVQFNGAWLSTGVSKVFLFKTFHGCDSTVTVSVTGLPGQSSTVNLTACPGSNAVFNGTPITAGESQIFTFKSANGCDSTVTVKVATLSPTSSTVNLAACPGSFAQFLGQNIAAGTSQTFKLTNAAGCDSTVTVKVATLSPTSSTVNLAACPGSFAQFLGENIPAGGSKNFVLPNAVGCDSTIAVAVAALPAMDFEAAVEPSCSNLPDGKISLKNATGAAPFEFSIDGGLNWLTASSNSPDVDFQQVATGKATVTARDGNGCLFEKPVSVPAIEPISVELSDLILPCDSLVFAFQPVVAGGGSDVEFLWESPSAGQLSTAKNFTTNGPTALTFSAKNRCETISRSVKSEWDEATIGSILYAPNAFAPDGERNPTWRLHLANEAQVSDYQLTVFDRWGNKVFSTTDPSASWDGNSRGRRRLPGVYVWMVEGVMEVCGEKRRLGAKGDVTLVR